MKLTTRNKLTAAAVALASTSAYAHDPAEFDRRFAPPAPVAVPSTCIELADPAHFSIDESNPAIKSLTLRCDAESAEAQRLKALREPTAEQAPESSDDE